MDKIRTMKKLLLVAIVCGVLGYGILFYINWKMAVAIMLIHYSINLERVISSMGRGK